MKYTYLILFLVASFSMTAQYGSKNFIDQNYIEVTGTAEMEVVPDLIYLHISISEKDKKGRVSVEREEKKMYKALEKIGIDVQKNISIISFSSTYIRYFLKKNDVEKVKEYELLLTEASLLAPVYKVLDDLEISEVSIVKLDHSQIDELKQKTKIAAIVAAKDKANLYTKAIHQKAGRAIYIVEQDALVSQNSVYTSNVMLNNNRSYASSKFRNELSTPIQLRKIHITARVLTKFELK